MNAIQRLRAWFAAASGRTRGFLVIGVIVGLLAISAGYQAIVEPIQRKGDAEQACQGYIEQALRAPASAEFGEFETEERTEYGYTVTGDVDSQNGFGALLRNSYTCKVNQVGDSWILIDLEFAGQ